MTELLERINGVLGEPVRCDRAPAELLDDVHAFLGRFVAYPSEHAHVAHTLWVGHTHMMDAWESTPRIAFLSPEPGSGKTRALEISELLVPHPVEAVNVTPAYLFRKVGNEDERPTILFDEIDTVFGPKAKDNEEIRGLLNAGHRRGAVAGRCVVRGKLVETEEIPAYCAVALAGLDDLPDTLMSRSVLIRMRRRAPTETVEAYRRRVHGPEGNALRSQLEAWAADLDLSDTWPEIPEGIQDRDADVWEALLAVADAAGGDWPDRSRTAAVALVAHSRERTPSMGVRLLSDLRQVFGEHDAMSTDGLLEALHAIDEAPWIDIRGKPLDARGLAQRLRKYGIKPHTVRVGQTTAKGYARSDLWDTWVRYLPGVSDVTHVTHSQQPNTEDVTLKESTNTKVKGDRYRGSDTSVGPPHYGSVTSVTNDTGDCIACTDCKNWDGSCSKGWQVSDPNMPRLCGDFTS